MMINRYVRSSLSSAAGRYQVIALERSQSSAAAIEMHRNGGGHHHQQQHQEEQAILLPVIPYDGDGGSHRGSRQMTARSATGGLVVEMPHDQASTDDHDLDNVAEEDVNGDEQANINGFDVEGGEIDEDAMHIVDAEWLSKLEVDLAQASRLEQDLQLLCALRQKPAQSEKKAKKEHSGEFPDVFKKNSKSQPSNNTEQPPHPGADGKLNYYHHNSRALDNLKIEGKNSFGIPCTDIFDDDFDEELSMLLRGSRHFKYPKSGLNSSDQQSPSRLLISGTSMSKKRMISIASQIPIPNNRDDGGISREEQSPLFAEVTTPLPPNPNNNNPNNHHKSRATSVARKKAAANLSSSSATISNGGATGDALSVISGPYSASVAMAAAKAGTLPVTHNSHRTGLLGGSLSTKPARKIFKPALPSNDAAALQVHLTCNSNGVLAERRRNNSPVTTADCTTSRSGAYASSRYCSRSLVPRLWVAPPWPSKNTKQPFKQLRRSHRSLVDVATNNVVTIDQLLRKNFEKAALHLQNDDDDNGGDDGSDELQEKFADVDDAVAVYETSYWAKPPHPSSSNTVEAALMTNRYTKGMPVFERSATQMSLGSILTAIRTANDSMSYTK